MKSEEMVQEARDVYSGIERTLRGYGAVDKLQKEMALILCDSRSKG